MFKSYKKKYQSKGKIEEELNDFDKFEERANKVEGQVKRREKQDLYQSSLGENQNQLNQYIQAFKYSNPDATDEEAEAVALAAVFHKDKKAKENYLKAIGGGDKIKGYKQYNKNFNSIKNKYNLFDMGTANTNNADAEMTSEAEYNTFTRFNPETIKKEKEEKYFDKQIVPFKGITQDTQKAGDPIVISLYGGDSMDLKIDKEFNDYAASKGYIYVEKLNGFIPKELANVDWNNKEQRIKAKNILSEKRFELQDLVNEFKKQNLMKDKSLWKTKKTPYEEKILTFNRNNTMNQKNKKYPSYQNKGKMKTEDERYAEEEAYQKKLWAGYQPKDKKDQMRQMQLDAQKIQEEKAMKKQRQMDNDIFIGKNSSISDNLRKQKEMEEADYESDRIEAFNDSGFGKLYNMGEEAINEGYNKIKSGIENKITDFNESKRLASESKNMQKLSTKDLYEKMTGKSWASAKKEGLTDGSFEANMALRQQLLGGKSMAKMQMGGKIYGKTHQEGGVPISDTQGNPQIEAEGGERIFTVEDTAMLEQMANAIDSTENQEEKDMIAMELGYAVVDMINSQNQMSQQEMPQQQMQRGGKIKSIDLMNEF